MDLEKIEVAAKDEVIDIMREATTRCKKCVKEFEEKEILSSSKNPDLLLGRGVGAILDEIRSQKNFPPPHW